MLVDVGELRDLCTFKELGKVVDLGPDSVVVICELMGASLQIFRFQANAAR